MNSTLSRCIALVILIVTSGWLSLKLSVPPGYASPIWPPAGIALGALLLWGKRYWVVIWAGSFLLNWWVGSSQTAPLSITTALSAAGIATGSTAQALAAAMLCKFVDRSAIPRLDTPRSVILFFTLAGPLACMIAPTVGVATLLITGIMPSPAAFFSWWNWWVGDSLGVIIVAPLFFCLLATPREFWGPRRLTVALPQAIFLFALIAVFVFVFRAEQARLQLEFNNRANAIDQQLSEELNRVTHGTMNMHDIYQASAGFDRHRFENYAPSLLERYPEIQILEWQPLVNQSQLAAFEQSARKQGLKDYAVKERDANGHLQPPSPRPEYYPVLFIAPLPGNESALGLDSGSNPASWQSKALARATGKPTVSQRILLVQDNQTKYAVLLSSPVYTDSTAASPDKLKGFITAIFHPDALLTQALEGMNHHQFNITLDDLNAPEGEHRLFTLPALQPLTEHDGITPWQHAFMFADREWQLTISPDRSFITAYGSPLAWLTLIGGLIFTGLLNAFLLTMTGRTAQVQALVERRTREVRNSENRLRFLLETSPIAVRIAKNGGHDVTFANPRYDELIMVDHGYALRLDPQAYYANPKDYDDILQQLARGNRIENRLIELAIPEYGAKWALATYLPFEYEGEAAVIGWFYDITDRIRTTRALQESEKNLRQAQEIAKLGSWFIDVESNQLTWSEQTYRIYGIKPDTPLSYNTFLERVHPQDREHVDQAWSNALDGAPFDIEHRIIAQGETRWVHQQAEMRFNPAGQLMSGIGTIQDITERKHAQEKLVLAARVFSEAHEGITITDANGFIIDVNPTFCEITGYRKDEVIGKKHNLLKSGKHLDSFYDAMWQSLMTRGHWQGEVWNRKKSGELYAELLTISALRDENDQTLYYVGLFSDITQSKHQQQALEMMAHYDVLTQLPNRVLFADRFSQAIARCKRDAGSLLAVCYFDLDGFKQVNDTLGHEAGDQLLIQVAERMKSMLREEDTISRLGGDEFVLLLGDIRTIDQCKQTLERIHRTIAQPYLISEQLVSIMASSGISIYPLDDADPDTLLRHADQAMYQAKLAGRNRFHLFDAAHDMHLQQQRLKLESFELALARHEFELYYQPKVNMRTGEVFGAEALIRWNHPEHGMLPPAEFLPIIVGTSLEISLGNWVIQQSMAQIQQWNDVGLNLQVSVNISPRHLQWEGFFANLDAALAKHPEIPSHQFELEVLESVVVEDVATISEVLNSCRNTLGVNIALDDFGTGYSSLTHLRHLPANMIKIDQSFVRDMLDDPDDYSIIEGVIGLTHAFRRNVIAEGVESPEHGLLLLNMGCNLAQGYGISRPMPASQLPVWAKTYTPHEAWTAYIQNPPLPERTEYFALTLQITQWIRRFKEALKTPPGEIPRWPIMHATKSHCGRWLQHEREIHHDQAPLQRFAEAHEQLHHLGNTLMLQYQSGERQDTTRLIQQLDQCYERMIQLLQTAK